MNRPFPVRPHKMTPRGLQLPLLVLAGTSHRSIAAPFATSIFFSFCGVKNATQRESGDQNGLYAPSLPGRSRDSDSASGRTHNCAFPAVRPTKASMVPSGDPFFGDLEKLDDRNIFVPAPRSPQGVAAAVAKRAR